MLDRLLEWLTAPLPRAARLFFIPLIGLALVLVFVFLGFPYDVVADRAVDEVEARTGAIIQYGEVEPRLTVGGPGFRFNEVVVRLPDGRRFQIDPISVRPAWSTSWFTGSPQLRAFVASDHGNLAGFLTVGRSFGWNGRIVALDLALLPIRAGFTRVDVSGRADIDADVRYEGGLAEGEIDFTAHAGEVVHPMLPMPIEFETLIGHVVLGGDHLARIESLTMEGPLFAGDVEGTVGHAAMPGEQPLGFSIGIEIREPGMRGMVQNFGLNLDKEGHADLRIGGTLTNPEIQ